MKMLNHPNIVNLVEVIDDPSTDHFYMGIYSTSFPCSMCSFFPSNNVIWVWKPFLAWRFFPLKISWLIICLTANSFFCSSVLEYVEGKWVCEGSGTPGGLGENTARKYLRDIVSGLIYLHAHVWFEVWFYIIFYKMTCISLHSLCSFHELRIFICYYFVNM